jgi:predicted CxxxxCH...CXXCH cytochrome family protein
MRFVRSAALALAATSMLAACSTANELDQSSASAGCAQCHGLPPAQGAHIAHAAGGTYAQPIGCATCHVVPQETTHAQDGAADVQLSGLAVKDVASPGFGPDGRCAAYCHGSTDLLGNRTSPAWTSTNPLVCGSCHTTAPTSGFHTGHLNRGIACEDCHPGYAVSPPSVNLATHVNGALEATPVNTGQAISAWPAECSGCHSATPPPL